MKRLLSIAVTAASVLPGELDINGKPVPDVVRRNLLDGFDVPDIADMGMTLNKIHHDVLEHGRANAGFLRPTAGWIRVPPGVDIEFPPGELDINGKPVPDVIRHNLLDGYDVIRARVPDVNREPVQPTLKRGIFLPFGLGGFYGWLFPPKEQPERPRSKIFLPFGLGGFYGWFFPPKE